MYMLIQDTKGKQVKTLDRIHDTLGALGEGREVLLNALNR